MKNLNEMSGEHVMRYGLLYGSRMPWLKNAGQIRTKIFLASERQTAKINYIQSPDGTVWNRYCRLALDRLLVKPLILNDGITSINVLKKIDKMRRYGGFI